MDAVNKEFMPFQQVREGQVFSMCRAGLDVGPVQFDAIKCRGNKYFELGRNEVGSCAGNPEVLVYGDAVKLLSKALGYAQ